MKENYKKFFTDILEMSDINFLEIRIKHMKKGYFFSKYVKTIKELEVVLKKFNTPLFNLYYGCNVRPEKERKVRNIKYRRFFYFDIEHSKNKPPITNNQYQKNLNKTLKFLINEMWIKYKLKPNVIYTTGRGVHLGYKHKKISVEEYDKKFKKWYTDVQDSLDKIKPVKEIKFLDPTKDAARIGGCPSTINYKYPEKPVRQILKINTHNNNDIKNILDRYKMPDYKVVKRKGKKYTIKTIFNSPEFKVFKKGVPSGEGWSVNNKLRFALNLLCRDSGFSQNEFDIVAEKISELGYEYKPMSPPNEDYNYTTGLLNNWCLEHQEWCIEKKFKLPYKIIKPIRYIPSDDKKVFECRELKNIKDVLNYIADFNNKYENHDGRYPLIYYKSLEENILSNVDNNVFKKFLIMNDLIKDLAGWRGKGTLGL